MPTKGLHGVGLFMAEQSVMVTRMPLRHLADFKGKKIRIFASQFQSEAFQRLGITPVAMTLGDVLPAIQQGAIDGAVTGIGPVANFHMVDAAKYVTLTGQPAIFLIAEVNQKWFEALPKDLQQIVERDAKAQSLAIDPYAVEAGETVRGKLYVRRRRTDQAAAKRARRDDENNCERRPGRVEQNPALAAAYKIVADAAARNGAISEPVMRAARNTRQHAGA